MALVTEFLEQHEDGVVFNRVYSNTLGKAVLQVETGVIYGEVAITDTDPYTYQEVDAPEYEYNEREDMLHALNTLGVNTEEE